MIVGLAGRMGSGKSTLSNELLKKGFKKVAFADYLKKSLSETYEIDLYRMYNPVKKSELLENDILWNENYANKLFNICNINDFNIKIENKKFSTLRELMQYVGSDVLRVYDKDFHVKKTIEQLSDNENYVFDDFRFPNELEALQKKGTKCYFILRPENNVISNHISETSLNWSNFDNHIINDDSIQKFIDNFINYEYKSNKDKYNIFSFLYPDKDSAYFAGLLSAIGTIKKEDKPKIHLKCTNENIIKQFASFVNATDNVYKEKEDFILSFYSPYIIENLKFWNLTLNKSCEYFVPDIIKNNNTLIDAWNKGYSNKL